MNLTPWMESLRGFVQQVLAEQPDPWRVGKVEAITGNRLTLSWPDSTATWTTNVPYMRHYAPVVGDQVVARATRSNGLIVEGALA